MAARIRKGDTVIVISGKDKGKTGKIQRILRDEDRVVVEGINLVKRHMRPTPRNPSGGDPRARAAHPRLQGDAGRPQLGQGHARPVQDSREREESSHCGQERGRDPRGRGVNGHVGRKEAEG